MVVQINNLDRQRILKAGGQFLNTHLDTALTGHTHHRVIAVRQLHTHGGRQTKPHGAQTTGVDPAPWLVELVVLRRPHLMLANIRGHEGIAPGHLVQALQHVLWLDQLTVAIELQTILRTPFVDLLPPFPKGLRIRLCLVFFDDIEHGLEDILNTPHNGHVHLDVL